MKTHVHFVGMEQHSVARLQLLAGEGPRVCNRQTRESITLPFSPRHEHQARCDRDSHHKISREMLGSIPRARQPRGRSCTGPQNAALLHEYQRSLTRTSIGIDDRIT